MAYGASIIPAKSAGWTLLNADIVDGVLNISAGGSAKYAVNEQELRALTETFKVSLSTNIDCDPYNPACMVKVFAKGKVVDLTAPNKFFNYTLFPTLASAGVYSTILEMDVIEYEYLVFEISSSIDIQFSLYELCPEVEADIDLSTIIDGVNQSLPRVVYDYNTDAFTVGEEETTISIIGAKLLADTDLQGHLVWTFVASKPGRVTLRFKDNGVTELWSPLFYDIGAGRNTIGVPHSYLERLMGTHTYTVTAQMDSGTLTTGIRGLLFTVDGGYLVERTYNIGADVLDIALRKPLNQTEPDFIYMSSVDKGKPTIRRISYTAYSSESAEPVMVLEEEGCTDCKIAFDGVWAKVAQSDKTTLYTDEVPWIFWLQDGNLYAQKYNYENTKKLLASSVAYFDVIKGYQSYNIPTLDQGIVVVYVSGGKLYSLQHAYNAEAKNAVWPDIADEIPEAGTGLIECAISRLNDYRLCIVATSETTNKVLATGRTYTGGSIPDETFYTTVSEANARVTIAYRKDEVNPIEYTIKADGKKVLVTLPFDVKLVTNYVENTFSIDGSSYTIKAVKTNGNVITFDMDQEVLGGIRIYIRPGHLYVYRTDVTIHDWYGLGLSDFTLPDAVYKETFVFEPSLAKSHISLLENGKLRIAYDEDFLISANVGATGVNFIECAHESAGDVTEVISFDPTISELGITLEYVGTIVG